MNRRRGIFLGVIVALVLAAAGAAFVLATGREEHGGTTAGHVHGAAAAGPIDPVRFIDLMIPHHQMAIAMARTALARAKDPEIRGVALDVVTGQAFEITAMWRIRARLAPDEPVHVPTPEEEAEMGMGRDHAALAGAPDVDRAFAELMIPHHAGALVLADRLLQGTPPADLARLARGMQAAQGMEIGILERVRRELAAGIDRRHRPATTPVAPVTP